MAAITPSQLQWKSDSALLLGVESEQYHWHSENLHMTFTLNLDEEQSARLEERARELGVDARELAKAAVNDLLSRPSEEFDLVARLILEKNQELYRRLSQ